MLSHPQRQQIANEVHARPFQQLSAPLKVMHFALMNGQEDMAEIRLSVSELLIKCGAQAIPEDEVFNFQRINELSIRWEAHTEYYSLTFYYSGSEQNWEQSMPGLPLHWHQQLLGELIAGVQLLIETPPNKDGGDIPADSKTLKDIFGKEQVIGSHVVRGAATVWTDFKAQGEFGLNRILIYDNNLHGYQCGRLIQRLCEIDTYRAVALLGLEPAQQAMIKVLKLEKELVIISKHLSDLKSDEKSEALNTVMNLAAQIEEISVGTANRFSASDAYYAMVRMRISELEETRVEGLQTMEQFIERRVDPAMRTWQSAASRLNRLCKRISQASSLLRSAIDLSTDEQIHHLLTSMNKRTRRQLLLQAKLETFSIIVVTYYIFDLLERTIHHLSPVSYEETAVNWLSYSLPAVIAIVWWYVRKVTKEFQKD